MPPPALCLVTAALVAVAGFAFALPRPTRRPLFWGVPLLVSGLILFGVAALRAAGLPTDSTVANVLFLSSAVATLIFAGSMVIQRNPARGAIAFTSMILSLGGVFLVLGAPFLIAVEVIVYAGAIIVTFLFVLMLSNSGEASSENDRSREPLAGALGGMALAGLVTYVLLYGSGAPPGQARWLVGENRLALEEAYQHLAAGEQSADAVEAKAHWRDAAGALERAWGTAAKPQPPAGLDTRAANPATAALARGVGDARAAAEKHAKDAQADADLESARKHSVAAREPLVPYLGAGRLPARNIGNIGLMLYSEHLIAVELAGTLLLVATIGAVAVANRKGIA